MKNKKIFTATILILILSAVFAAVLSACTGANITPAMRDAAEAYVLPEIKSGDREIFLPQSADSAVSIAFLGSNNKNTITAGGTSEKLKIYAPIEEIDVNLDFSITDGTNYATFTKTVSVPPAASAEIIGDGEKNAKPSVVPAIREWQGGFSELVLADNSIQIYIPEYDDEFKAAADVLVADVEKLAGITLSVVNAEKSENSGYLEEGYGIKISERITIEAATAKGVAMAGKTLLQMIKNNPVSLPYGNMRDYPEYETRGVILDVAKNFKSATELTNLVKELSYNKINDVHLVLSNNEEFRLENSYANLQSDKHYTIAEFATLRIFAENNGVTIVPEINLSDNAGRLLASDYGITVGFIDAADPTKFDYAGMLSGKGKNGHSSEFPQKIMPLTDSYYSDNSGEKKTAFLAGGIMGIGGGGGFSDVAAGKVYRQYLNEVTFEYQSRHEATVRLKSDKNNPAGTVLTKEYASVNTPATPEHFLNAAKVQVNVSPGDNPEIYLLEGMGVINTITENLTKGEVSRLKPNEMNGKTYAAGHPGFLGMAVSFDETEDAAEIMPLFAQKLWDAGADMPASGGTGNGVWIAIGVAIGAGVLVTLIPVTAKTVKAKNNNK